MTFMPQVPRSLLLGANGPEVGSVAWGMWRMSGSRNEASSLVHAALEAGLNLLDTADIYGFDGAGGFGDAEALLGDVLKAEPQLRSQIVLATKGGIRPPVPYDQSSEYLSSAIDASLKRLRVDYIDLYQIHRPDILAHPHDVARVLDDAVAAGKVRLVGVSNFTPAQIDALREFISAPLVSTQPEISPLRVTCFENGELDQAMRLGLRPLAWSPLGGGRLLEPETQRERAIAAALDAVASEQNVSRSVAAYSWLMSHPAGIIPIIGSQKPERIREASAAADVRWSRAQWYSVFVAARGENLP